MNKTNDILTAQETLSVSTQTSVIDSNSNCNITIKPYHKRLHRDITSQRYHNMIINVKQKKHYKMCLNELQSECKECNENNKKKYLMNLGISNIGKKRILSTDEMILEECKRNQFKARPFNVNVFSSSNNENEMKLIEYKKKIRNWSKYNNKDCNSGDKENIGSKNKSFTPSPLPSFTFLEMKKSNRPLTIAHSPCLRTKLRYIQRKQNKNNNTNTINITPITSTNTNNNNITISHFNI
jgi:hypothetical protein